MQCSWSPEEVTDSCVLPCECWESNWGLVEEQLLHVLWNLVGLESCFLTYSLHVSVCCILNRWRGQLKCGFSSLECGLFINDLCSMTVMYNLLLSVVSFKQWGARWAVADPGNPMRVRGRLAMQTKLTKRAFMFRQGMGKGRSLQFPDMSILFCFITSFVLFYLFFSL